MVDMVVQVVLVDNLDLEQLGDLALQLVVDTVYLDLGLLVGVGIGHLPLGYQAVVDIVHSHRD